MSGIIFKNYLILDQNALLIKRLFEKYLQIINEVYIYDRTSKFVVYDDPGHAFSFDRNSPGTIFTFDG